jgi:hypothetical protein
VVETSARIDDDDVLRLLYDRRCAVVISRGLTCETTTL